MAFIENDYTKDAIFRNLVSVRQRRNGYRFSIDAILLAWYVSKLKGIKALELGTGSGVVSLGLSFQRPELLIDAVELQKSLVQLARANVRDNELANMHVIEHDLREMAGKRWQNAYDFVFSNPPYRSVGRGRLNPDEEKAIARHELKTTLEEVLQCSCYCLKRGGSIALILMAEREDDAGKILKSINFQVSQRTAIQPYPDKDANLILLLAREKGQKILPEYNFFIWKEKGEYSDLVHSILSGSWNEIPHPLR